MRGKNDNDSELQNQSYQLTKDHKQDDVEKKNKS